MAAELWTMGPVSSPSLSWGAVRGNKRHECKHCHIPLLTGETAGFCCGPGGKFLAQTPPLPPLPPEFDVLLAHPRISHLSRKLNLVFSMAALETTHAFPTLRGPQVSVAIQGRIYHRIRSQHENSAVRWLLYDGDIDDSPLPHPNQRDHIPIALISAAKAGLLRVNPLMQWIRTFSALSSDQPSLRLVLHDTGAANEIAALISFENTTAQEVQPRRLTISRFDGHSQYISTFSRLWEPLSYPLLFPHGTLGWGRAGLLQDVDTSVDGGLALAHGETATDNEGGQMWHYRAFILREPRFRIFGRLANEYLVDMFSRSLESRLNYIRNNQLCLRKEEAALMGADHVPDSENVYLPASFLGSKKWSSEQAADALAIAGVHGGPTIFVTMTCNSRWPEITSQLLPGQGYEDCPDVVCRVFKRKLTLLLTALKTLFPSVGKPVYVIYSVEFQKRGLPHAHILVKYPSDLTDPAAIDAVVSAELPDDPVDRELVTQFMIHHHSTPPEPISPYCQREDAFGRRRCRFKYPKPIQPFTEVNDDGYVQYRRRSSNDEYVVPHNLVLLRKFQCHMNIEVASTSHLFQYLFKYIHKGPDYAKFAVRSVGSEDSTVDEIDEYLQARYLTSLEACWRILGYNITHKEPAVTALAVHLGEDVSHRAYATRRGVPASSSSTLDHYFVRPVGSFISRGTVRSFADLLYTEYWSLFRTAKYDPAKDERSNYFRERASLPGQDLMHVILRSDARPHVTRLHALRVSQGESFYLRRLLQYKSGYSYAEVRTVNGIVHPTFQGAAVAAGLFADEQEAEYAMQEAVETLKTPAQLRFLFLDLLLNDCAPSPLALWNQFSAYLSTDHSLRLHSTDLGANACLEDLARRLNEQGKTLEQFGLPAIRHFGREVAHERARWDQRADSLAAQAGEAVQTMNAEQRAIFFEVASAIQERRPLRLFIDGKAGRGKTFLVNAIVNYVRSIHEIVIPTATAAYAALLYPGGRTAHSTFKIPVNDKNEFLVSEIEADDPRGELLREAAVIIWDEMPMANRAAVACTEETLRRVMREGSLPFGGKIVLTLGDFRQTCPVVPHGSRADVVDASIKSSPLWNEFSIRRLIAPIRNAADPEFAAYVDWLGEGAGPLVPILMVPIVEHEIDLLDFAFPPRITSNPTACFRRAILAPLNAQINRYNTLVLERLPGESHTYYSSDSIKEIDDAGDAEDILPASLLQGISGRHIHGLPPHALTLKPMCVCRILRNLSVSRGLVKNVRVVVVDIGRRIVTVRILREDAEGRAFIDPEEILLPRIPFLHELGSGHTLVRRQYPLDLAYSTTFNGCQGLTLNKAAVDLTSPVFSHGQLYTALSRIRTRADGMVRTVDRAAYTSNVTYREILV